MLIGVEVLKGGIEGDFSAFEALYKQKVKFREISLKIPTHLSLDEVLLNPSEPSC